MPRLGTDPVTGTRMADSIQIPTTAEWSRPARHAGSRSVVHDRRPRRIRGRDRHAFGTPDGIRIVSLLKIFRMRDGEIVLLRDYFSPDLVT